MVNQGVEVVATWGAFGQSQVLDENGLATTCLARDYKDPKRVLVREATKQDVLEEGFRIRKLTPKECWRLQGFPDWAFEKAEKVNSNSQLYKQAGNSVTVNVIEAIAKEFEVSV